MLLSTAVPQAQQADTFSSVWHTHRTRVCLTWARLHVRSRRELTGENDAPRSRRLNMSEADAELPKAVIKRIVKAKVAELGQGADGAAKRDVQVNREALAAFTQATKVFISYVAGAAHDVCKENKRSTVLPKDVLQALGELNFGAFIPQLEELLAGAPAHPCSIFRYYAVAAS